MNIVIQRSYTMAVTVKPASAANTAAIAAFLVNKSVTIAAPAVAQGLRKTRYIARVTKSVTKMAIDNRQ